MRSLSIVAFVALTTVIYGQDKERPSPVFDIGVQYGFQYRSYFSVEKDDWNRLTPGIANPGDSDTTLEEYRYGGSVIAAPLYGLSISRSLNIPKFQQRQLTPLLVLTAETGTYYRADIFWQKEERYRYDTLTSSLTGEQFFIDSVSRYSARKTYEASVASASLGFVLQTNREKRFSYLFGLGIYGAFAKGRVEFHERTESEAIDGEDSTTYYHSNPAYYPFDRSSSNEVTLFDGPSVWQLGLRVPLGVDFVIGKEKRPFWHRTVLSAQGALDYQRTVIQGYNDFTKFNYSLSPALKFRING